MVPRKWKVVITDAEYPSFEAEKKVFAPLNVDLVKCQCTTEEELVRECRDADALLNQYAKLTPRVIEQLDHVKIIARYGIGVDNVDLAAATKKHIYVTNVVYDICDVADHAVMLMLALARKLMQVEKNIQELVWDWKKFHPSPRIKGKTVGIIGLGRVGRQVARRLSGFDVRLLACDPYIPTEIFAAFHAECVDRKTLLESSDIVTIHVPLNAETRNMIGAKELKFMKKTALLINAARGGIVNEHALYEALNDKQIAGAGLDVLEHEPIQKGNPFLRFENVLITPHMGWYSEDTVEEVQRIAAEQVFQCLRGMTPTNLVNSEVLKTR